MTRLPLIIEDSLPALSARVVADLTALISERTSSGSDFHVSLTGGRLGNQIVHDLFQVPEINANPRLHIWWSDERYVPLGHEDRNDLPVPQVAREGKVHIHSVRGPDTSESPQASAEQYSQELHLATTTRFCATNTLMDVTVLGIGPDGHVASLFPHSAQLDSTHGTIAITDSPKPPPVRVTWTYPTLNASEQVWIVATGADKAEAIQAVLDGADFRDIPAVAVHGTVSTHIMIDVELAQKLTPPTT